VDPNIDFDSPPSSENLDELMALADLPVVPTESNLPPPLSLDTLDSSEDESVSSYVADHFKEEDTDLRREIVFVDARTPSYEQLLDDLDLGDAGRDYVVVVLDANRDGIEQIGEVLGSYRGLDAVHIVSHGTDTSVQLGDTWLSQDNLADYRDGITAWADAFSEDADLLFYGCNFAGSEDGRALIDDLASLTGADVAASDDLTGNALLGCDWDLEYRAGDIETAVAFSSTAQQDWSGVLVTPNITARETVDADSDGQIDQIRITTDQNLDDDFSGLTVAVSGYTVTGYSSDVANDNIFYADLTESGSPDTGTTPTATVTANTTLSEFGRQHHPERIRRVQQYRH
jgi:hypothetical protein